MAGWLLGEAAKADVGAYALSNDAFLLDLADGAQDAHRPDRRLREGRSIAIGFAEAGG